MAAASNRAPGICAWAPECCSGHSPSTHSCQVGARTSHAMQKTPSGPQRSKFADIALIATLAGVLVVLFVSMTNQKELARLRARVQQLETLASAATAVTGTTWNKIYEVKTATAPVKGGET